MRHNHDKKGILYLATFDPTVSATGTATRGKLFLRFFCEHYDTHLVHMKEKDEEGKDKSIVEKLASETTIAYSNFDYFLFSTKFYQAAKMVLQHQPIDFIFADFEKSGWYAYLLSKQFQIPYIYNSHNVEFLRYMDFAKRNALRYPFVPFMYFVERQACKNALFTVAISEQDAKTFRGWVPEKKVLSMPCAFDEKDFHPFYDEITTPDPIVLMVGNYRNPGNREGAYLVREKIFPDVLKKYPNTIFRCVGKGFPEDIRHPNIQPLGFVQDLMTEYRSATVVIVPITIGGGIKIKAIEGLACGKCVISTPKGVEGIDTSELENLTVLPIEKFSKCIVNIISKPVCKTTNNWDKIHKGYGIRHQFSVIKEKIDMALSENL